MTPQHPAAPEGESDARCTCANDGHARRCPHHAQADYDASAASAGRLTETEREALSDEIRAANIPILMGWRTGWLRVLAEGLAPIVAERVRVVEGERDAAREKAEWWERTCTYWNEQATEAQRFRDLNLARAESAEAAHAALRAGVEALAEEAAERAYMQIAVEKCLTVMRVGDGRAAVPGHWRDEAEAGATVTVANLRALLAGGGE